MFITFISNYGRVTRGTQRTHKSSSVGNKAQGEARYRKHKKLNWAAAKIKTFK